MNRFDQVFFSRYVDDHDAIEQVFHRHIFIVLEDVILWTFFGLIIPWFLYYYDAFSLQTSLAFWQVATWMFMIYVILIYKLCDWYYDVWIATEKTMIDVKWRWFTSNLLYIPYDKIEWVEVRVRSILHSFIGMADVIIKLAGDDRFVLTAASKSGEIVSYIQRVGTVKKGHDNEDDREPFEILVDTLSDVVKGQIATGWKDYITREYIDRLDTTLHEEDVIDLRKSDEKVQIEVWKKHHQKVAHDNDTEGDEHKEEHH
jgi:Bacterial PH domain